MQRERKGAEDPSLFQVRLIDTLSLQLCLKSPQHSAEATSSCRVTEVMVDVFYKQTNKQKTLSMELVGWGWGETSKCGLLFTDQQKELPGTQSQTSNGPKKPSEKYQDGDFKENQEN
ncbi:Hypothetical predicted protein [Podarcis lilfordi]|uniref:Uncharacterized protein n=1 Tax=Podarcis lilfordi TaxID=74358 RepID=A0AA35LI91_9SAUR|nr:Hypothetical predicted protein [Podarcis lilfordi]